MLKKYVTASNLYIFLTMLPKIVPPILLAIDCFFFLQIKLFYKSLLLLILPLIYKSIIHVYTIHYTYHCDIMDERIFIYKEKPLDENLIITQEYVELMSSEINSNTKSSFIFELQETYVRATCEQAQIHVMYFDRKATLNYFKIILHNLYLNFNLISALQEEKLRYDKKVMLFITIIYMICWIYILVISFHTLDTKALQELLSWFPITGKNPFDS